MTPMPTTLCPFFAAGFDWLEALLPFLFVAFWIVSQVFAALRRLQGGGARPQPPARVDRPRGLPRPAGRAADDVRSELERQIEEFLRQSTGDPARRPAVPADRDRPPAGGQPRPKAQPVPERPSAPRPQPGPAAAPARRPRESTTAAKQQANRPPSASAAPAATVPAAQTESVARHVQDAFAHELGHLRGGLAHEEVRSEAAAAPPANGVAAEVLEMLRSPAATRRAILVREVLERPVDRW